MDVALFYTESKTMKECVKIACLLLTKAEARWRPPKYNTVYYEPCRPKILSTVSYASDTLPQKRPTFVFLLLLGDRAKF